MSLAIIVLAAGCSARLGQPKQLINYHHQTLVERQLQLALRISSNVSCVLGFDAQRIQQKIAHLDVKVVENQQWQQGLASSIACGVNHVADDCEAVMLLLVDQWQLQVADLQKLTAQWCKNPQTIVATSAEHLKAFGPPVIFPQAYFKQLASLQQGQGAKSLLKQYQDKVIFVAMESAFVDLDTPEQLAHFRHYVNDN